MLLVDHTSTVSGAEISLLDLIGGLAGEHLVTLAAPPGELANAARSLGVAVEEIPPIEGSLRLSPRPTAATLAAIAAAGLAIRRISRATGADVVHANSLRAGLAASFAAALGAPRPVVHLRDCLPPTPTARATQWILSRSARAILANSAFTAACFEGAPAGAQVTVVHNPIDLERFDLARIDRAQARAELGLSPGRTVLAVVGQITPWKGQDTAIEATRILRERGHDVELLIAGSVKFRRPMTRYDNDAYLRALHEAVSAQGLDNAVTFTGETGDVPRLLRAVDCVLVPSWAEPWGRVVVEAMAMGTPVTATNVGGTTELVEHEHNGLLIPPREPAAWAEAVQRLIEDPSLRQTVIESGLLTARRFDRDRHVAEVLATYRQPRGRPRQRRLRHNAEE